MRRDLGAGYELDDDVARIDVVAVHAFLTAAYWAQGRSLEVVEDIVRTSARVVGLYNAGCQVGFARVLSDGHTTCYLADVYVLEPHRGHGYGEAMVEMCVEGSELSGLKWLLHTRDAHSLYRRLGFHEPSARVLER